MTAITVGIAGLRSVCSWIVQRVGLGSSPQMLNTSEIAARIAASWVLHIQHGEARVGRLLDPILNHVSGDHDVSDRSLARMALIYAMMSERSHSERAAGSVTRNAIDDRDVRYLLIGARLFRAVRGQDVDEIRAAAAELGVVSHAEDASPEAVLFAARYLPAAEDVLNHQEDHSELFSSASNVLDKVDPMLAPLWSVTMTNSPVWRQTVEKITQIVHHAGPRYHVDFPRSSTEHALVLTHSHLDEGQTIGALECGLLAYVTWHIVGSPRMMFHRPAILPAMLMMVRGACDRTLVEAALKACPDDISYRYSCYELLSPAIVGCDQGLIHYLLSQHADHPTKLVSEIARDRPVYHIVSELDPLQPDPHVSERTYAEWVAGRHHVNDYLREIGASHLSGLHACFGSSKDVLRHVHTQTECHRNTHSSWFRVSRLLLMHRYETSGARQEWRSALLEQLSACSEEIVVGLVERIAAGDVPRTRLDAFAFLQTMEIEHKANVRQYRAAGRELQALHRELSQKITQTERRIRQLRRAQSFLLLNMMSAMQRWREEVSATLLEDSRKATARRIAGDVDREINELNGHLLPL